MSILSAMVVVAASMALTAAQQPQPDVTIYRSWRAPNVTVVEGMFRVDPELLGTSDCSYGVRLLVQDNDGMELSKTEWTGECPVSNGVQLGGLETFQFNVVPATYRVTVEVFPLSNPNRRAVRVTGPCARLPCNPCASRLRRNRLPQSSPCCPPCRNTPAASSAR